MLRVYLGALGAGKSYGMVEDALVEFRAGRRVYSLTDDILFAKQLSLAEFQHLTLNATAPGLYLLDEAGLHLWARAWTSRSLDDVKSFVFSRKRGLDIWYTAQFEEQVEKVVRELTTERVLCMSFAKSYFLRFYSSRQIRFGRFCRQIYELYDTFSGLQNRPLDDSFQSVVNYAIDESLRKIRQKKYSGGRYDYEY